MSADPRALAERPRGYVRLLGLPRVAAIRDGAVSNRDYANRRLILGELVDDPVGAHAKRAQPSQAPAQHVAGQRIAFV